MLAIYLTMVDNQEDKDKFQKIYNQYDALLHTIALEILHDQQLSEDAVQECYLKVINNLQKINESICPQTKNFLVIIIKNVSIDILRAQNKNQTISVEEIDDIPESSNKINSTVDFEQLVELIRGLPDIYKDVIFLKYNHNYSNTEIAKILGISHDTVKKRLQRARNLIEGRA